MELEDLTQILAHKEKECAQLDTVADQIIKRFQKEFNSLNIINTLSFVCQYIDNNLYLREEDLLENKLKRLASKESMSENVFTKIDAVFEKDPTDQASNKINTLRSLKTFKEEDTPPADEESSRNTISSPQRRSLKRSNTLRQKSSPEVKYLIQDPETQEKIRHFFETYHHGPGTIANKIIQAYNKIKWLHGHLEFDINQQVLTFKDKMEEYNELIKELERRKKIIQSNREHCRIWCN